MHDSHQIARESTRARKKEQVRIVKENQPKMIIFQNTLSIDHFITFNLMSDDNSFPLMSDFGFDECNLFPEDNSFFQLLESATLDLDKFPSNSSSTTCSSTIFQKETQKDSSSGDFVHSFSPFDLISTVNSPNFNNAANKDQSSLIPHQNSFCEGENKKIDSFSCQFHNDISKSPSSLQNPFIQNQFPYIPAQILLIPLNPFPQQNQYAFVPFSYFPHLSQQNLGINNQSKCPIIHADIQESFKQEPLSPSPPNFHSDSLVSSQSTSDDKFKIEFLTLMCKHFPGTLKKDVSQFIDSSECPNVMKVKMSSRKVKRISREEFLEFIMEIFPQFSQLMNEEKITFLLYKVHFEYFVKVPAQKKFRIERFIELFSLVSSHFGVNSKLAELKRNIQL
jgi:hypothetical protein